LVVKPALDWDGSSHHQQAYPPYDLQFEDLSILEQRRPNLDIQPSLTGFTALTS